MENSEEVCKITTVSHFTNDYKKLYDKMLLWLRHQGRCRHYNSIRDPQQGSKVRIQDETAKQGAGPSVPTIQAGHIVDKRVPEVGTAGSLLAGADLGGIATRGFMTI